MPGVIPLRPPPPQAHPVIKDKISVTKRDGRKPAQLMIHDLPSRRVRSSFDPRDDWINSIYQASLVKSDPRRTFQRHEFPQNSPSTRENHVESRIGSSTLGNPTFASIAPVRSSLQDIEMDLDEVVARYDKLVQDDYHIVGHTHFSGENGAFTPVVEDLSPDPDSARDAGSSPVGPATPFGEYVDRAVNAATAHVGVAYDFPERGAPSEAFGGALAVDPVYVPPAGSYGPIVPPLAAVHVRPPTPQVEPTSTSSISDAYRKLADPLAHWVSDFVWTACTVGHGGPFSRSTKQTFFKGAGKSPVATPRTLPESVRSLLLSTLLQPSAVFLALWYIVRLPVCFGHMAAEGDATLFREELLFKGDASIDSEAFAAFRLVVLGFMLANKWLDDHTFSNKTWNTISHIPIHSLNRLEFLAVNLFHHDLSIDMASWAEWLEQLRVFHTSLAAHDCSSVIPLYPQPISRPSATPHAMIRKTLDDIIQASCSVVEVESTVTPQPVYLGLNNRSQERRARDAKLEEFNMDEDGPLREEYLPRRRSSGNHAPQGVGVAPTIAEPGNWDERAFSRGRDHLPPPARWSPEADEPLSRSRDRSVGRYVAVQPAIGFQSTLYRSPYDEEIAKKPYATTYDSHNWYQPHIPDFHPTVGHARSQSQQYGPDRRDVPNHSRPRSNTRTDYQHAGHQTDVFVPPPPMLSSDCWAPLTAYAVPYVHQGVPPATFHMAWLRA